MALPTVFNRSPASIATYDFMDIAAGTGIINFYAGKETTSYLLSNFTYYADTVSTSAVVNYVPYTKVLDVDFDVSINKPITLKGNSIINIPLKLYFSTANVYCYAVVKVRKWDGSTETDLVTSANSREVATAGAGTYYDILGVQATIPLTVFKKGETLRLTIEVWGKGGGALATVDLAHDPKNRSAGWDTTGAVPSQLAFQCPTRIDL